MLALSHPLFERFKITFGESANRRLDAISLDWPAFDALLPDHGLPRGVIEVRAPKALGGSTLVALAAMRSLHRADAQSWCAWLDPEASLYAPGVAMAGVDLNRLLVIRPPRAEVLRSSLKAVRSSAFGLIAIDVDPAHHDARSPRDRSRQDIEVFVRKAALLAGESGATVLLLTDSQVNRSVPLPVALRLELTRTEQTLRVHVAKERYGRIGRTEALPLDARPKLCFSPLGFSPLVQRAPFVQPGR
ncbi:MAG: recombinase A [Polyangiaceae bacterium]|nr:recombinase A [Polyangiaceae bacterium]